MKLYGSASIAEKQRMIENNEKQLQERQDQQAQQAQQAQQETLEAQKQMEQAKMEHEDRLNQRDNDTKIIVANIQHNADDGIEEIEYSQEAKDKLAETIRQFDARLSLDKDRLKLEEKKTKEDLEIKRAALKKRNTNTSK
jgi:hypothetical protein